MEYRRFVSKTNLRDIVEQIVSYKPSVIIIKVVWMISLLTITLHLPTLVQSYLFILFTCKQQIAYPSRPTFDPRRITKIND